MKKCLVIFIISLNMVPGFAQETIYPAKPFDGLLIIQNGTVHVGNGKVLENTSILINKGKIEKMGNDISPSNARIIDAAGKHVYPGLILSNTNIGLREIASQVKGSNDFVEIGDLNPNIQSIVAYNTDSKIINTLRSNGILLANIVPRGSLLAGSSSVVQFDAWTWEDAVYKSNYGIHFYMPSLINRPNRTGIAPPVDPVKESLNKIETVRSFLEQARVYNKTDKPVNSNLKFDAVKGLFDKSQRLFIHCNFVKEMLMAIDFAKDFGFDVTIVGGADSWQIPGLLKQNNISVILQQLHSLPTSDDDDIDQRFKTPAILQQARVLFAITDEDQTTTGRNLIFNAGTAANYGLTKEEAMQAITLSAAKILGIDAKTGSIEIGKDANLIISEGDILDMRTSVVTNAFIQGREINLDDKHKQLNERYKTRYGIK